MITENAKRKVALFLKEFYTEANIGVGGNSPNPNSNNLDVPILGTNKTTTNSQSSDLIIDFTATFTGSELNGNTVREFGIFGTLPAEGAFDEMYGGTANPATEGSNYVSEEIMLTRFNFDALGPFSASDELEIIVTVGVE